MASDVELAIYRAAGDAAVLLRQELHREMDAVELAAGDRQIARLLRAGRDEHGVELVHQLLGFDVDSHMHAAAELHALRRHLIDPAGDVMLLHLEVGDAQRE